MRNEVCMPGSTFRCTTPHKGWPAMSNLASNNAQKRALAAALSAMSGSGLHVKEDGWLQPGWERSREGHFVVRTRKVGGLHVSQTYVTRAGLVWLRHRWLAKLIVDARDAERARIQATLDL